MRRLIYDATAGAVSVVSGFLKPYTEAGYRQLVSFTGLERPDVDAIRRKRNSELLARVDEVSASLREDKDNVALQLELDEATAAVFAVADYIKVSKDASREEIEKLIRAEKVYPMVGKGEPITDDHIQEFRENRLGGEGMNRDIMRLQIDHEDGTKFLGHLCRWHSDVIERTTSKATGEKAGPFPKNHLTTMFWSICSYFPGAGSQIIKLESQSVTDVFRTTLSPSRQPSPKAKGFTELYDRDEIFKLSDDEIRRMVVEHQLTQRDDVRDFHLGEGACIGYIQINRDAPIGSEDWIMINYFYEPEHVKRNKAYFHAENRKLAVSDYVHQYVPEHLQAKVHKVERGHKPMPRFAA